MRPVFIASVVILLAAGKFSAQVSPSSSKQTRTTQVRLGVRAVDGSSLSDVRITLSGDASGDFTTGGAGTVIFPQLKDGTYRVRCEHDGFITLEREFTLRGGAPTVVDIALSAAPPPPPPAPPPTPPVAKVAPPSGPPVSLSVIEYLERNFIDRDDPIKESILACTPLETVRLLQMRDPIAAHRHADVDELLYVVAGEGVAKVGGQVVPLKAGTMVVVPHTTEHAIERRGKNPLMLLSTLAGAPCTESTGTK
jgi:hypothetical protein